MRVVSLNSRLAPSRSGSVRTSWPSGGGRMRTPAVDSAIAGYPSAPWANFSTVARLDVIEGPFDDEPAQFSKLIVQLGLELMAGLGRQFRLAESDDEATDLADHRNQANGQREQGSGEVSCQVECCRRSMIYWASFTGN